MRHAGDVLVEMLLGYGVQAVFGLPGGQTLPLYDAIRSRAPRIRHVAMRDERNAAYAADGYARLSGRVGVCDATVGPGAIKLTSGLAEALNSSIPLVALISDVPSDWLAARYRGSGNQIVDQLAVLAPLCKWTGRLPSAERLPELIRYSFQMAASGRPGPVVVDLPEDLFKQSSDASPQVDERYGTVPPHRFVPAPESLRAAVGLLESAARPVMIVGGGGWISGARDAIAALAERLALPVATTLSGKGVLPETHPLALGVLGTLGGSAVAHDLIRAADLVFTVGFKFGQNPTFKWTLPVPGQRVIQLDIDSAEIGKMVPVEIGLVGDARATLEAMAGLCEVERPIDGIAARIAALKVAWKNHLAAKTQHETPIRPQQVVDLIDSLAGPDDVLVCDASFASGWGGLYFQVRDNRRALFPRGISGLGWALPAAIGVQVARPGSKTIVLAGDGAMTYSLGELATLVQEGMNVAVVVLNNSAMGWIKWEQAVFWDGRFLSTDLGDVDFAQVARGLGCHGARTGDPAQLADALAQTLAAEGPAVLDVRTAADESSVTKFLESDTGRAYMRAQSRRQPPGRGG